MSTPPREFMTADEMAAEISATHDVHYDCAHTTLEQVARWRGVSPDRLIRFGKACPAGGVVCGRAPELAAALGHTAVAHRAMNWLLGAGITTAAAVRAATNEELLDIRNMGSRSLHIIREHFPHIPSDPPTPKEQPVALRDELAALEKITADLDGYIERRAAELAAPLIARAKGEAAEIAKAAVLDAQRQADLVKEMRRQMTVLIRRSDQHALAQKTIRAWTSRSLEGQTAQALHDVNAALTARSEDQ